jgi:hypothetical protein
MNWTLIKAGAAIVFNAIVIIAAFKSRKPPRGRYIR